MPTRKGKIRPSRPPVNRKRQKTVVNTLVRRMENPAPARVVSLAQIQQIREQALGNRTRGGLALRTNGEYGASGTLNVFGRIYNEDYNTMFDGKSGLAIFDQMDRSDGQVGSASEIIKLPIRAAKFIAEYPKEPTQKEKDITDAINAALFENDDWPSGESWDFYLRHLLMRVTHGFGLVEKVWMFDEDAGVLRWRRLAPRLPRTVTEFMPNVDGSLKDIVQYVSIPGTGRFESRTIPSEYAILSVREREGDNYFGRSVYRRIYKHWFYKDEAYRIDGIRLDRFGVGIPVAKIEEGHVLDGEELNEIETLLQALRTHERAYIIEPPDVTFRIMVPEGGHGGVTGLMESVQHHDTMIVRGTLATFMSDHAEGLNTNRTKTLADIFLHSLKAEANSIAGDLQSQAVRPFCRNNFNMLDARYPVVKCVGLGDMTVEQLSTTVAPLIGEGGAITAEDTLEDYLRTTFGLPPLPQGWRRGDKKPEPPALPANGNGGPGAKPNPNPEQIDASQIITFGTVRYVRDPKGKFSSTGGPKAPNDEARGAAIMGELTKMPEARQTAVSAVSHTDAQVQAARAALDNGLSPEAVLDELGPDASPQFKELFDKIDGADSELKTTLTGLKEDLPNAEIVQGPPKGLNRAVEKTVRKDSGDVRELRDPVRASVSVDRYEDVPRTVARIDERLRKNGGSIIAAEDRFSNPTPGGYRDLNLNVRLSNGVVGEVQVHLNPILKVKHGRGWELYNQWRAIAERSAPDTSAMKKLESESKALYDNAWREAGGR